MKACVMPAPAPWANTKPARGCGGRVNSAETAPALLVAIESCWTSILVIERASPAGRKDATHGQGWSDRITRCRGLKELATALERHVQSPHSAGISRAGPEWSHRDRNDRSQR